MSNNVEQASSDEFSHLNEVQKEAVLTVDGPLLLLAGAGSGKTTVLMNRIANLLLNRDVSGHEIIAITFTNKAAGEMKERLGRMNVPGSDNVWACTFHSACVRILRRDIEHLGYDSSFTIYDTADTSSLIKRIMKDLEIEERNFPHRTVQSYISRAKDSMIFAGEFLSSALKSGDPRRKIIGQIYVEYEKRLRAANSLDFDDLILLTVRLFKENPDVLERYQRRFKYVLVDEYQDTNNLQYLLTAGLAGLHGNICVVGDDDQSIYKFRGATIENILNFEKQFKNAKIIRLEQNYRSTGMILNAANDVIKNNRGRKGKNLWTENTTGEKPALYIVSDEREEAKFVADKLLESVTGGRKWQEHVILYRMNAQSNQFETAFKRNGIPYRIFGGTGFYDRAEIKDMLAYLCVIFNPNDDVRLLRIINNPARGIGDTTVDRLVYIASELGISVFAAIRECQNYENMKSAAAKLHKFADMIDKLRELSNTIPLDQLYDELIFRTGYIRMLEDKNLDENISRIENVKELKTNIIAFMNESDGSLFDFLSETALYTDLDRDDQSTDRVLMMTMHSAKGLEFDTVFIAGAEEGVFPGMRAIGEPDEMEEERRLCYVAMTRAMRKLYFTSARRRMLFGRTSSSEPSRFVREINNEHIDINCSTSELSDYTPSFKQKETSQWQKPYQHRSPTPDTPSASDSAPGFSFVTAPAPKPKAPQPTLAINKGDTIEHKAFGRGIVLNITPAGGDALLEIAFDSEGTKRLMLNSAQRYITK
ncbi:MAG: UvrD-helicase domain-containing protein [Oscillospiraceae bacterium]|nr:UvrD-helicase domain-containing protein [Oscillospiraceae bacterium]